MLFERAFGLFRATIPAACLTGFIPCDAATFRVATYNVENYVDTRTESRSAKSDEARAKVRESILAASPDVLALQEMGSTNALAGLAGALKKAGLDFPHWEHVAGFDTNVHVAVLSRFPFAARRSHPNDTFLLNGRRFRVSRGFAEVEVQVCPNYSFTLLVAHLKSKRQVAEGDEAELRLEEARLLREKVDAILDSRGDANVAVVGDLNDTKDSSSTRMVVGRGKAKLVDTRPAEQNGDDLPNPVPQYDPRNVTWTHYYGKEDSYSRIDYILLSPGMAKEWVKEQTRIVQVPNWGMGSDHRPLVAVFSAQDN